MRIFVAVLLAVVLAVAVNAQGLNDVQNNLHFERLGEPYTYQRINYDLWRMGYNMRYPNYREPYGYARWQPASWSDIFGPRTGKK